MLRATGGEYYSADSIKTSGQEYKTLVGRTVYGGGGIIPDVFVPRDTTDLTSYFKEAYMRGLIYQFAYVFSDEHREALTRLGSINEIVRYMGRHDLTEEFAVFAERSGLKRRNLLLRQSADLFREYITSNVINDVLDEDAATQFVNQTDPAVLVAVDIIGRCASVPKANGSSRKKSAWLESRGFAQGKNAISLIAQFVSPLAPNVVSRAEIYAICSARKRNHCAQG